MSDEEQPEIDDSSIDTVGVVEPEAGSMEINAGPLRVCFKKGETGGLRVIQDGTFLAISQGVDYGDGDRATVGHDLTATEARELAIILSQAAEQADECARDNDRQPDPDSESLLERVVSGVVPGGDS